MEKRFCDGVEGLIPSRHLINGVRLKHKPNRYVEAPYVIMDVRTGMEQHLCNDHFYELMNYWATGGFPLEAHYQLSRF